MEEYDLSRNVHRITNYSTISSEHQHPGNRKPRLYLHIDMNCFYAQVEQQCYNLFGIPVIVGGWRKDNGIPRGIVATSSYEARSFGIKTGMSAYEAVQLCPYLLPLQVHYEKYQAISREVHSILRNYAPDVEAYSADEFFLNITHLLNYSRDEIHAYGEEIKNRLYRDVHLLSSVGIARSKTYAKLASDLKKPNGLTLVLSPEEAVEKLHELSLDEVWGIGSRRYAKLQAEGLNTIADAVERGSGAFQKIFGAYFGKMLFETVVGKDCGKVMEDLGHDPKDVSYMHTFSDWSDDLERVKGELSKAVRQLCYRLRGYNKKAENYSGYIRFQDDTWRGVSFKFSTEGLTNLDDYVLNACSEKAVPILRHYLGEGHRIRGIGLRTIDLDGTHQLELFFREDEKLRGLCYAVDNINNRFGLETVMQASLKYSVEGKTHFLERNS